MMISDLKHGLFKYDVKDYYAILGVPISASAKDIRLRYLKIAYQLHPDTNRSETEEEKKRASNILAKIVNPAYENLYKDNLRKECQLILAEIGQRLATDQDKIIISSENAKKLLQEEKNLDEIYLETIEKFANEQYLDLEKLSLKIGLLSELNMVYLMRQKGVQVKDSRSVSQIFSSPPVITKVPEVSKSVREDNSPVDQPPTKKPLSRLEKLITSAKQHLENDNYEQGVLDMREAVKLEPNNATAHALLGLLYLKQGNNTYAKIHINKAVGLDSNDSMVKDAQKALKEAGKPSQGDSKGKVTKEAKTAKSSDKSKDKGKETKGKKEAPKIFGIPLW